MRESYLADNKSPSKSGQPDGSHGQLVTCQVDELHPHPSYVKLGLRVTASELSTLAERGSLAFQEPLVITRGHTILDGYARWELARLQGRVTLSCIEYDFSEEESLCWLLQRHRRRSGLSDFFRILLAMELEPWFKEKARSNQRAGGHEKGSSNLTEAERMDVRSEVATAAGVSVGNVSKVKQLMECAHPEIQQALRDGEIRIHRAWLWSKAPLEKQREALLLYRSERGIKRTIRALVLRHRSQSSPTVPDLDNLMKLLATLKSNTHGPVNVAVIRAPGRAVFVTEELFRALELQEELVATCAIDNH